MDAACLDLLCSGVVLLDARGIVRHVNGAAEELLGRPRRNLVGEAAIDCLPPDEFLDARFWPALRGELGIVHHEVAAAAGGLDLTIVPLHAQPWAALLELRPVRQHASLERQQELSKELGVQRESLRNLAHEIKNPLGGLRAAAQLARAEFDDPRLGEYTGVIVAEADRLKDLIDRMLVPQSQPIRIGAFNVHEVCERARSLVGAEFGPRVAVLRDYDASVPELRGDAARLFQALLNIVRNAAQALSEHADAESPRIILRTRVDHQAALRGRPLRQGLVISVIDNGPGVPPRLADRIFHPFVTGRASGTGLGLSLAQEYVQQMDGLIELDSVPGHTEFRLILPMERV